MAESSNGWIKGIFGGTLGLVGGAVTMYSTAIFDKVVKPAKPMANFSTKVDGFDLICEARSTGESGWWDFGDGTALEPYQANQTVKHTYTKTGNYNVKLIVRNFLSEENDRTVPVEIGTKKVDAANPQVANSPKIILSVEPTTPNPTAPATFKVRAEVQNAEKAFIDVVSPQITQAGGASPNKIEVKPAGGIIETLILVEKPGDHAIQLFGTKGNEVIKQTAFVKVSAPAEGTLVAYLTVRDSYTKSETKNETQTQPIKLPNPTNANEPKTFERTLTGIPGFQIQDVKIDAKAMPIISKLATNVKCEISADKQMVKLTGEWVGKPQDVAKKANGTDLMIPLTFVYVSQTNVSDEKKVTLRLTQNRVTDNLPAVPAGVANFKREIDVMLNRYVARGEKETITTGKVAPNAPLKQNLNSGTRTIEFSVNVSDKQATAELKQLQ